MKIKEFFWFCMGLFALFLALGIANEPWLVVPVIIIAILSSYNLRDVEIDC